MTCRKARMKTLVIGGTRNLGPDLVDALLARGDEVTVLNRGVTPADLPAGVARLRADRASEKEMGEALAGTSWDTVIDATLYTGAEAEVLLRVLEGRCGRYVFWSTGQVYLVRAGISAPFRETDYDGPLMPEPPHENATDHDNWRYGIGKRDAEDRLRGAFVARGFPYVSLRMPMINSRRDHYRRLAAYVHRILDGGPILVPDDQAALRLRHVFGDDVVAASLRATLPDVPAGTCVNVSQDDTFTLDDMLARIGRLMNREARTVKVPRAELERHGLLPHCSPWSGRWMSRLANDAGKHVLGMRYTSVDDYLPVLVEAALRTPLTLVPGNDRRREEIALAADQE